MGGEAGLRQRDFMLVGLDDDIGAIHPDDGADGSAGRVDDLGSGVLGYRRRQRRCDGQRQDRNRTKDESHFSPIP